MVKKRKYKKGHFCISFFFYFHIPHIPDIPDIPHIPHIPHIPDIPHIPHIPDIPHIPEIFNLGISSQTGFFLGGVFGTFFWVGFLAHYGPIPPSPILLKASKSITTPLLDGIRARHRVTPTLFHWYLFVHQGEGRQRSQLLLLHAQRLT